jgi:hypothetical protein
MTIPVGDGIHGIAGHSRPGKGVRADRLNRHQTKRLLRQSPRLGQYCVYAGGGQALDSDRLRVRRDRDCDALRHLLDPVSARRIGDEQHRPWRVQTKQGTIDCRHVARCYVGVTCRPAYPGYMSAMRTPDGLWRVEVLRFRTGTEMFRVRQPLRVAASERGWWPTGQLCATVAEVQRLLGESFTDQEPVEE